MASPTVNFYSSTDVDAPILNAEPGSLITVLNACLVNGYGTKSGAGWTLLGQGTAASNPYTAMYQMGSGSRCVLYVNDNSTGSYSSAGQMAILTGGLPTSQWSSGLVGSFPASSGISMCLTKSIRVSQSVAVPWWIIATTNVVYIIVQQGAYFGSSYTAASLAIPSVFTFGDIFGAKVSDQYPCHIQGDQNYIWTNTYYYTSICGFTKIGFGNTNPGNVFMYMATSSNSLTQSPVGVKIMDQSLWSSPQDSYVSVTASVAPGYPDTVANIATPNAYDNGYYMSPLRVASAGDGLRGYLPGMWAPQQYIPFPMYQTFSSPEGQFAGRSFFAVPAIVYTGTTSNMCNPDNTTTYTTNAGYGQFVFEVSSTWT